MKKYITLLLMTFVVHGFSQHNNNKNFHVNFFGGLALSNFEAQESSASGMIAGLYIGFSFLNRMELGVELNSTISPFNRQTEMYLHTFEENISQHVISVYNNFYFYKRKRLDIFTRVGAGYYWGDFEQKSTETYKRPFKRALGFHIGAGFHFDEGILVMAQYHFVNREFDEESGGKLRMDNLQVSIGYQFSF